jgi:glucose/mannose-6-phosphate isomerase
MVADGWRAGSLTLHTARPSALIVAGMGGSGIGGQLLRSIVAPHCPVAVVPVPAATLPAFAGRGTLVFACSYSGSTEETLTAFDAAREQGAMIVAITSGGPLADRARAHACPVVMLPAGQPPRSALPYQLAAMLRVMAGLGLAQIDAGQVTEAVQVAERLSVTWGPATPTAANLAKQLARRLMDAVPVIYAASPDLAPVAYRWKTQVNEHAKTFAMWNAFPELSHNETVGWARVAEAGIRPAVVILRDRDDGDRAAREVDATRALAFSGAKSIDDVWSQGEGSLARMLSLVVLGDFTSVYLACLAGVDPTPIDVIAAIKRRLQEAQGTRGTPKT